MVIVLVVIITTSNFTLSYASHGGGRSGGGGCSGDCKPPTLGVDDRGVIRVEGGLTINSESFDVEMYSQDIQVQVFTIGERIT